MKLQGRWGGRFPRQPPTHTDSPALDARAAADHPGAGAAHQRTTTLPQRPTLVRETQAADELPRGELPQAVIRTSNPTLLSYFSRPHLDSISSQKLQRPLFHLDQLECVLRGSLTWSTCVTPPSSRSPTSKGYSFAAVTPEFSPRTRNPTATREKSNVRPSCSITEAPVLRPHYPADRLPAH